MIQINKNELHGSYEINVENTPIGEILIKENRFHGKNKYLDLKLNNYNASIAKEVFSSIANNEKRPLQIIIPAKGMNSKIRFIEAGGFHCKRNCYEMEVHKSELIEKTVSTGTISHAMRTDDDFNKCAKLLYEQYKNNHQSVAPLTASFEDFCSKTPDEVLFWKDSTGILYGAFIEQDEISYIFGKNNEISRDFAADVVCWLFSSNNEISFECDDNDNSAMILKSLFSAEPVEIYRTYIYDYNYE